MKEILYFTAPWCNPCKQLGKIMDSVNGQVNVRKINVDNDTELSAKYSVRNVPTLVLVKDGVVLKRTVGLQTKQQILDFYNG